MWSFERIKEEIAATKDWFSLKYESWDFLVKTKEEDGKEIIRIFYKQKFVDEIIWFRDGKDTFYSSPFIISPKMFYIFNKIWVLLIPKTFLSNGVVSWFSCYDENLKKMFDTDWVYWDFDYKYWKIYLHEVINNNIRNLWKQFAIDRDWMRAVREKTKKFSNWNIYQELNDIKDINKEWLYNLCVTNKKKKNENSYYTWSFFVLLKELLNVSKSFFWEEYTVNLEDITRLSKNFWDDYAIVITNKIKIGIEWEKKISEEKYVEFQKLILTNFSQLLAVKFEKNEDISDNYCSFFLRIENDGKISNLQKIQHFFKSFPHALSNGRTIIYPTFPVSKEYLDNDADRVCKFYITKILISENQKWKFSFFDKRGIFYSFLNDEASYLRKFLKGKETKDKKDHYKIIFFIWMKILEEKYWKWIYILEIKNGKNLRFLREDWSVIFSMDNSSFKTISPYNITFNEKTWTCFFSPLYWTNDNIICLNLTNSKYKILSNVKLNFPYTNPSNYYLEQYIKNKTNNTYFIQPENIFDIDFKKFKPEYVIWKYITYYFQKTWMRWLNFIIREKHKYQIERFDDYDTWRIDKYKALYWTFSWKWFLSLLYSLDTEIGELTTKCDKPLFVNDNLKIWFFIPLA